MGTQYDSIIKEYKQGIELSFNYKYLFIPTFFEVLGDIEDKSILDLACGEGVFTRLLKKSGASKVVGVDYTAGQIEYAKEQEQQDPLGIEFRLYDVRDMPKLGDFDIVTGTMLLHHAETRQDLDAMCGSISNNVKSGGRFVGLNNNPIHPLIKDPKYDVLVSADEPLEEGDPIRITLLCGGEEITSFFNYWWRQETYTGALEKAGFHDVKWIGMRISQQGIEEFGQEFWQDYHEKSHVAIIEAVKS